MYLLRHFNSSRIAQINNLNFLTAKLRGKVDAEPISAPTQWTQSLKQWFWSVSTKSSYCWTHTSRKSTAGLWSRGGRGASSPAAPSVCFLLHRKLCRVRRQSGNTVLVNAPQWRADVGSGWLLCLSVLTTILTGAGLNPVQNVLLWWSRVFILSEADIPGIYTYHQEHDQEADLAPAESQCCVQEALQHKIWWRCVFLKSHTELRAALR